MLCLYFLVFSEDYRKDQIDEKTPAFNPFELLDLFRYSPDKDTRDLTLFTVDGKKSAGRDIFIVSVDIQISRKWR